MSLSPWDRVLALPAIQWIHLWHPGSPARVARQEKDAAMTN